MDDYDGVNDDDGEEGGGGEEKIEKNYHFLKDNEIRVESEKKKNHKV